MCEQRKKWKAYNNEQLFRIWILFNFKVLSTQAISSWIMGKTLRMNGVNYTLENPSKGNLISCNDSFEESAYDRKIESHSFFFFANNNTALDIFV